uniref:Uncharacterized protein n=3 Tax=Oryza TaxID=4527 RepID=A0A0E0NWA2_ORYRU
MAMTSCPAGASAMLNLDLYSCRARHCVSPLPLASTDAMFNLKFRWYQLYIGLQLKCTVRTELTGGYSICSLLGTEKTEERGKPEVQEQVQDETFGKYNWTSVKM